MIESQALLGAATDPEVRRGAKARITAGDALLIVKERHADGTPFWTLPGGGLDPGASHVEALRRELHAELTCRNVVGEPVETVWYAQRSEPRRVTRYKVFDCAVTSAPSSNVAEGLLEYRWAEPPAFPPRTLPQVRQLCPGASTR